MLSKGLKKDSSRLIPIAIDYKEENGGDSNSLKLIKNYKASNKASTSAI